MNFWDIKKNIWALFLIIAIILLVLALINLTKNEAENGKANNLFISFIVFILLAMISFFVFNLN